MKSEQRLLKPLHTPRLCAGDVCPWHNPTDHHMRGWPKAISAQNGLTLRTCPHGHEHPDPDSVAYGHREWDFGYDLHECDGCCDEV